MIDLKRYAGTDVVVQLKSSEKWFAMCAPPKSAKMSLPDLIKARNSENDLVPVPLPFIEGKVTSEGSLLVNTGSGGVISVEIAAEAISSVTHVVTFADEPSQGPNLVIVGN